MAITYCKGCLKKQKKIKELEEEVACLKDKQRYQRRTAKEGFFGSSTLSSKVPVKPNSSTRHQRNRGGGKPGHNGHGRSSICEQDADAVERVAIDNVCPDCGNALEGKRRQSPNSNRLPADQNEKDCISSSTQALSQMQKGNQRQAPRCACQVLVLKSTAGICGSPALHLWQHIRSDRKTNRCRLQ